ncbi:hypothetical protein HBB16_12950 [Pseudonocardia sp. MCCB 268]|nr:hypothetical protein [Pseudonocardia cytotoxica]
MLVGNGRAEGTREAELRQLWVATADRRRVVLMLLDDAGGAAPCPVESVTFGDPPGVDPADESAPVPARTSLTGPRARQAGSAGAQDESAVATAIAAARGVAQPALSAFADLLPTAGTAAGNAHTRAWSPNPVRNGMPAQLCLDDHSHPRWSAGRAGGKDETCLLAWISGLRRPLRRVARSSCTCSTSRRRLTFWFAPSRTGTARTSWLPQLADRGERQRRQEFGLAHAAAPVPT